MVKATTCAVCNKPLPLNAGKELKTFPFCGVRCQQVDLQRWMGGRYAIVETAAPEQILDHFAEQAEFEGPNFDADD